MKHTSTFHIKAFHLMTEKLHRKLQIGSKLKYLLFLLLALMSACSYRGIPPEVTALHQTPPRKNVSPIRSELIIVDAGHGGKDAGTCSKKDLYEEKQLTLETALFVADYLKQLGYKTVLTRRQDIFVSLDTRAEIANTTNADLFVSIHYNHSSSQEASGIEVYYYKENKTPPSLRILQSKDLGQEVLKKVIKETGAISRGCKEANFAVVRQTKMPAILIEAGFLSNPQERSKIKDVKYLRSLSRAIASGVDQYLTLHRKR